METLALFMKIPFLSLPYGTVEEVRAVVRQAILDAGAVGGYVTASILWLIISHHLVDSNYYRTQLGKEIDFLLERSDGSIVAIEVKSGFSVDSSSFAAMTSLSHDVKKRFVRGIVFYAGKEMMPFGKNLFALPLQSLWT